MHPQPSPGLDAAATPLTCDRFAPLLASVMDAQAHNDHQASLLFSPGGEVDSAVERVLELRGVVTDEQLRAVLEDLVGALESNQLERDCQHDVARPLDELVRDLYQAGDRAGIRVKELAAQLRPLLRDMGSSDQRVAAAASAGVAQIHARYGAQMARRSLSNALGSGPSRRLAEAIGRATAGASS